MTIKTTYMSFILMLIYSLLGCESNTKGVLLLVVKNNSMEVPLVDCKIEISGKDAIRIDSVVQNDDSNDGIIYEMSLLKDKRHPINVKMNNNSAHLDTSFWQADTTVVFLTFDHKMNDSTNSVASRRISGITGIKIVMPDERINNKVYYKEFNHAVIME